MKTRQLCRLSLIVLLGLACIRIFDHAATELSARRRGLQSSYIDNHRMVPAPCTLGNYSLFLAAAAEGIGHNKYLEIFNPTCHDIYLHDYVIANVSSVLWFTARKLTAPCNSLYGVGWVLTEPPCCRSTRTGRMTATRGTL